LNVRALNPPYSGPPSLVFKIVPEDMWRASVPTGRFAGSPVDLRDGYIHFSTAAQVKETAARHFSGQAGLQLVAVSVAALGDALRWKPSRGGDLFPHLYGELPMSAVLSVAPLPLGADGTHEFPF